MTVLASLGLAALCASRGAAALEAVGGTLCDTRDGAVLVRELVRSRDATLFQGQAAISSGKDTFLVGTTPNGVRRGLLAFEFEAGDFPSDAKVECAEVRLHAAEAVGGGAAPTLHRVTTAWTTSGANVLHGVNGGAVRTGDATWAYSAYPTSVWNSAGGDYADAAVATRAVDNDAVHAYGNTLSLARIVQDWVDVGRGPFNAGFLLRGDEGGGPGARYVRYDGLESAPALIPRLIVTYTSPSQGRPHRDYAAYLPEAPAVDGAAVPEAAAGGGGALARKLALAFVGGAGLGGLLGYLAGLGRARKGRAAGEAAGSGAPSAVKAVGLWEDEEASVTEPRIS